MKAKKGYRPWVAKKAPLFNTSLNATYIRVNTLLPIVIFSCGIGALLASASVNNVSNMYPTFFSKSEIKQEKIVEVKKRAPIPVQAYIRAAEPEMHEDMTTPVSVAPQVALPASVIVPAPVTVPVTAHITAQAPAPVMALKKSAAVDNTKKGGITVPSIPMSNHPKF